MQLIRKNRANICRSLGLLATALFAAHGAEAQELTASSGNYFGDETASTPGTIHLDTAVLFYQEAGGRVRAIEPTTNLTWNSFDGKVLNIGLIVDTLTGASPCGALPLNQPQTLISFLGEASTATGASSYAGYYMVPANTIPLARFHDRRVAFNISYSTPVNNSMRLGIGGGGSKENDYSSILGNLTLAKDFNQKNTTLSLGVSFSSDIISPDFGIPAPFERRIYTDHRRKAVTGVMLGLTQVMNRHWLAQINYNYGRAQGYQTDPYRAIVSIDAMATENPVIYGYFESRPETRVQHSLYLGNKIAIGHTALDISARLYHDSWGITSGTFEISDRLPLNSWLYIEPHFRWYTQSKANFFVNYLIAGEAFPAYASSDSRLSKFRATTFGLKAGFKIGESGELYLRGEYYGQKGDDHPAGVVPSLAQQNLFSGVKAVSAIVGYSFDF